MRKFEKNAYYCNTFMGVILFSYIEDGEGIHLTDGFLCHTYEKEVCI